MEDHQKSGPNAAQIEHWNEVAGEKWVRLQDRLDRQLEALGVAAMDAAALASGDAVLDVGCGCGATTLEIARRVGASGRAHGLDISATMLARARARAREAGLANASFEHADAQTHALAPATFDVLYSRFGVMFFADPTAAFTNLARSLRPSGRVAFVCWQGVASNPWMSLPTMAALEHVKIDLPTDPHAPGPFAFADAERVETILGDSGFADVSIDPIESVLAVGGGADLDDTVSFMMDLGPVARITATIDEATREAVTAAIRAALAPHHGPDGVKLDSAAWLVRARRA